TRAARRMEEALERYPDHAGAVKTRFQLAHCYRYVAQQALQKIKDARDEEERRHWRKQGQRLVESAASTFGQVVADLAALRAPPARTAEEEVMARQAAFALAECQFDLGQYPEALRLYEELAGR